MKLIICIALIVTIATAQGTCADNPIIEKIKTFVEAQQTQLEGINATKYQEFLTAIESYKQGNGDEYWTSQLEQPHCPDFNVKNSCCSDGLVKHFPSLFKAYMQNREQQDKPRQKELIRNMALGVGKCAGKEKTQEFLQGELVVALLDKLKACRVQQFKSQVRFLNRQTCALCFAGSEIVDRFQGLDTDFPKLYVKTSDLEDYETESIEVINCYNDLVTDEFKEHVKTYFQGLPDTLACKRIKQFVNDTMDDGGARSQVPAEGGCKSTAKFMAEGCVTNNEATAEEFSGISTGTQVAPPPRMLVEDESDFIAVLDGYGIFEEDANADDSIFEDVVDEEAESSNLVDLDEINTEGEQDEEDVDDADDVADDDDDDKVDSSSLLTISAMLCLAVLSIIV